MKKKKQNVLGAFCFILFVISCNTGWILDAVILIILFTLQGKNNHLIIPLGALDCNLREPFKMEIRWAAAPTSF